MDTISKISYLLEQSGRTQKELTDSLGIEKSVFSSWKTGKSKSYSKYLAQIAQFFNVSIDYLLDNERSSPDLSDEPQNEEYTILNRNAKKLTPEQQRKLIEMAKILFGEDWND